MRSLIYFLVFVFGVNAAHASFTIPGNTSVPPEKEVAASKGVVEKQVRDMSVEEYENYTGKKLNFFKRVSFKIAKTLYVKQLRRAEAETSGFNLGGFALGFFLPVIGVIISYIASSDSNFRKWSWFGFGAAVVASAILLGWAYSKIGF